jgi:hypothetical protein
MHVEAPRRGAASSAGEHPLSLPSRAGVGAHALARRVRAPHPARRRMARDAAADETLRATRAISRARNTPPQRGGGRGRRGGHGAAARARGPTLAARATVPAAPRAAPAILVRAHGVARDAGGADGAGPGCLCAAPSLAARGITVAAQPLRFADAASALGGTACPRGHAAVCGLASVGARGAREGGAAAAAGCACRRGERLGAAVATRAAPRRATRGIETLAI